MKLLGSIGIDIRLLLAQIINFLVLLWLLSKFVYRPVIARLEQDEEQLKAAKAERDRLDQEKVTFEGQKEQETKAAKERSRQIIEEAETIGKTIGQQTRDRMEQEGAAIIAQAKKRAVATESAAQRKAVGVFANKIEQRLRGMFRKDFPAKEISDMLFDLLMKETEAIHRDMVAHANPEVVLEYVQQPDVKQKKVLSAALEKKFKKEVPVTMRKNEALVNGFRLEWEGVVIESNIAHSIHNATKTK